MERGISANELARFELFGEAPRGLPPSERDVGVTGAERDRLIVDIASQLMSLSSLLVRLVGEGAALPPEHPLRLLHGGEAHQSAR